jgi:hypothetical protein
LAKQMTIILDDVSSDKKLMRSQILSYLASNSRHLQMSIFVLAQYHCQIVTEVRNQFDMVFLLNTSDSKSIVRLHAEFCSGLNYRIFKHVLGHVTQNFGMMIINNQATSIQMEDVCFTSRMPTYPPILEKLGPAAIWDYGHGYYCDENATRPDRATADNWQKDQDDHQTHHVVTDRVGKLIIRTG